jgi:hypothetical protein
MEAIMRRLLLSLALALTVSGVGAGSALAEAPEEAQTAPLYGPVPRGITCPTGGTPTPKTFGFAVLNTPGNEARLTGEVVLNHAAPKTTYRVDVVPVTSFVCFEFSPVGEITTNKQGNGNLHFRTVHDPTTNGAFVTVENALQTERFISPAVELD